MDERIKFVARLLEGESMSLVCREFGISRKTGYKVYDRYRSCGMDRLEDRSRRPARFGNQIPFQLEAAIVAARKEKPHWGAKKLRERLVRKLPPDVRMPSVSTIHAVLVRNGLIEPVKSRRPKVTGTHLSAGPSPNDVWCIDFKGQFHLADHRLCYPLTVTDHASRLLLLCEALQSVHGEPVYTALKSLFEERGLPTAMRSDNGAPFACPTSLFQLSKLSVWWLRLGITIERIQPGKPQQNGRHERMHLTLKRETARPAMENFLKQQQRFDDFIQEFNEERPHEALQMKTPAEIYTPATRKYQGLLPIDYPFHDRIVNVSQCGRVQIRGRKINVSEALAGQPLGILEVEEDVWLASFMQYDLGYFDLDERKIQTTENPFHTQKV